MGQGCWFLGSLAVSEVDPRCSRVGGVGVRGVPGVKTVRGLYELQIAQGGVASAG